MGYHHCPIEPSDWSNGPNDDDECPACGGDGWEDEDNHIACLRCHGHGFLMGDDQPDYLDYEPEDKS